MLRSVYIFVDSDFDIPLYAEPEPADVDPDVWETICEAVNEAIDGDGDSHGFTRIGDQTVGWKIHVKLGISFVAVVDQSVKTRHLASYLKGLTTRYLDEVDDARRPEREGVVDVVVDVIPPWEDDD